MEKLLTFNEWLNLREVSRWRRGENLRKIAKHTDKEGRVPRLNLLAKASKRLGRSEEDTLPGWRKFVDELPWQDRDGATTTRIVNRHGPEFHYRGSSQFDGIRGGGDRSRLGTLFGSPFPGVSAGYARVDQLNTATNSGAVNDGRRKYGALGRWEASPESEYTRDYGWRRGEDRHTTDQWHDREIYRKDAQQYGPHYAARKWHYETDVKGPFRGYSLARQDNVTGGDRYSVADIDDRGEKIMRSATRLLGKGHDPIEDRENDLSGEAYD